MAGTLREESSEKATITLPGTVEKIIKPISPVLPEKAQISVHGADDLYREIRVENTLQNDEGEPVKLKVGAEVTVTIEADKTETVPHKGDASAKPSEASSN